MSIKKVEPVENKQVKEEYHSDLKIDNSYRSTKVREITVNALVPDVERFIDKHIVPVAKEGKFITSIDVEASDIELIRRYEYVLINYYGFKVDVSICFRNINKSTGKYYITLSWY